MGRAFDGIRSPHRDPAVKREKTVWGIVMHGAAALELQVLLRPTTLKTVEDFTPGQLGPMWLGEFIFELNAS